MYVYKYCHFKKKSFFFISLTLPSVGDFKNLTHMYRTIFQKTTWNEIYIASPQENKTDTGNCVLHLEHQHLPAKAMQTHVYCKRRFHDKFQITNTSQQQYYQLYKQYRR